MSQHHLDAYVIPSQDAHQSEYVSEKDKRRGWISNFDGSMGLALVTHYHALLWTDSRYWLQAESQLDSIDARWKLMKLSVDPNWDIWLRDLYCWDDRTTPIRIGIDPYLISTSEFLAKKKFFQARSHNFVAVWPNLIDQIRGPVVPEQPGHIFLLDEKHLAGASPAEKYSRIRAKLVELYGSSKTTISLVLTSLDDVAWLLNLRAIGFIHFNPTFPVYLCLNFALDETSSEQSPTRGFVWMPTETDVESGPDLDQVRRHLESCGIAVRPYPAFVSDLLASDGGPLSATLKAGESGAVLVDSNSCNYAVFLALQGLELSASTTPDTLAGRPAPVHSDSPVVLMKAIKNEIELNGMRRAHLRDGAALVRFFAWLEHTLETDPDNSVLTEDGIAEVLEKQYRATQTEPRLPEDVGVPSGLSTFASPSFETISASGPNAAVIHYHPKPGKGARVTRNELFLLDSGAQYLDGTTDVTRTLHFGTPTQHQRECFTRVLQGHIALDTVIFPRGTTGYKLDLLARTALWEVGLDYRHGTGHGVGSFLNVHEGPHGIGTRSSTNDFAIQAGMTVSNEPGYYEDGHFGIRIENVLITVEKQTPHNFGGQNGKSNYLGFEHVTWVPIQCKLIDKSLLTRKQINWIDTYNCQTRKLLEPLVAHDQRALAWLRKETAPLDA